MIPERNLMAASCITYTQQTQWEADITDMMAEGPMVILRLPKIRMAIVAPPEPIVRFSKKMMELEILKLEMMNRIASCYMDEVLYKSDAILQEILRRAMEIVMEIKLRMIEEGCAVNNLMGIGDRMLQ